MSVDSKSETNASTQPQGTVHGKLVDQDGAPVAGAAVALFAQNVRTRTQLASGKTDSQGAYSLTYARTTPLNLVVQALGPSGAPIATSAVIFAAAADVTIDLSSASDGIVRAPSAYSVLSQQVTTQLQGTPLPELQENSKLREVNFVANASGVSFTDVAHLHIAQRLALKNKLSDATLFGLFTQGLPPSLQSALLDLPDAGIDDTFTAQVLTGVLGISRSTLDAALTTAIATNVLPASFAAQQDAQLNLLDTLRVQAAGASPYVRGKTSLNDLLTAASVDPTVSSAFIQAYAAAGKRLGPTWKALRANKSLTKAQLATLNTTLNVGELLGGNTLLVKDSLQRIAQGSLSSVQNLALLDEADWTTRIQQIDPQATSIPPVLTNDTPAQRIARFAKALAERFASRYPTTAFAGSLGKAATSSFSARDELVKTLTANPKLNLRRTSIDQYVLKNKVQLSPPALGQLKTIQRLQRLSPHYSTIEALNAAGYSSAQAVYFKGRAPFVAQMTQTMGSAALANAAWTRSQTIYATALATYGRYNLALNGINVAAMTSAVPATDSLANLPDLQALFGSLDYCECIDCRSVLSPAAYLVDLLQFLKARAATGSITNARDVLLARRPDIQYIALGCDNTDVTLPYIDVVNELLEAVIAPPATPVTLIQTTGTSTERRALPEQISQAAYSKTVAAVFPLTLPFDLAFAQTAAFLTTLGTSLADMMRLCYRGSAGSRAAAQLGLNPAMQAVINGTDTHQPWERWGFATQNNPPNVYDPKTRTLLNPTDWIAAMSKVPVLLGRVNLDFAGLCQLLEVLWVTGGTITLTLGTVVENGAAVATCDTELMSITGLDAAGLDRVSRFLRLLNATQLQMWELDWALAQSPGGALDDTFLASLADALTLRTRLGLPLQELLSFWGPLQTRDVTSHLGTADVLIPSTYSSVFRSPTLLAAWPGVFTAASALSGSAIVVPASPPPTPAQLANLNAIKAALGLSADDVAAILQASGAANALTLDTLNTLLCYARLASALSLTITDLLLWIVLTDSKPFAKPYGGTPADTLEFLRRLALLQGTGIALQDLDYLLRDGSGAQSAMAFTATQATAVLQAVRDAIAKLAPAAQSDPATLQTLFVSALVAATGATANVVTPVLTSTAILPLPAATITQLLAQTSGVDPSAFPTLVNAFTEVAKGAALFTALKPTESEFAFLVQNAATFSWLNPGALPLSTPATSPYKAFEMLLQALQLDRRQSARSPKLFDVLSTWIASLPPDINIAINGNNGALAQALNTTVADLTIVVATLGATQPGLTLATQPGSLADMSMLTSMATVVDTLAHYKVGAGNLVQLAVAPPTADSATAAMSVFQAQYAQSAWLSAVQQVEDSLRQARRDALVAYVIGQGPAVAVSPPLLSSDDLFDYYLIDPQMCACGTTTRLLEASLAVQQFVQQCFLGLVPQVTVDASTDPLWNEWSWMQQFRLWQANREVFLYPENYLLPELRSDQSPFFVDLGNDIRQSNCDDDAATSAFESYLRKLVEVANLVVSAHYHETRPDGSRVLHVFAHTNGAPPKWYYRTREESSQGSYGSGIWSAWEPLSLSIASDQVVPVVWDQRLHLLWPVFKQIAEKASTAPITATADTGSSSTTTYTTSAAPARKYWSVEFAMSELSAGEWQAARIYTQKCYFNVADPSLAFSFHAWQDPQFNLQLQVYYNFDSGLTAGANHFSLLVATATLPIPDSPLAVSEWSGIVNVITSSGMTSSPLLPDPATIDLSQEPTFAQLGSFAAQGVPPWKPTGYYRFYGQDLICTGPGNTPVNPLYVLAASGKSTPTTLELLGTISSQRLVIPQQELPFDSADPFFVADPSRTFFVQPHYYTVSSAPTEIDNFNYLSQWNTSYELDPFYHPFARTFLRELEIGGTDQLMQRNLQLNPQQVRGHGTFDFASVYNPQPPVATPYPVEDVDFSVQGAYSLYNWELFYHAPMYVAAQLMANQQYQDAMQWLEYIFNPSDPSPTPVPGHFWRTLPFYQMNATDWLNQQIQTILGNIAAGGSAAPPDPAIQDWLAHPFDPHRIARLRIGAYARSTVMKFLDNLITWGDSLYAQYTMENVAQAEQLYVFADLILGPQPELVRLPDANLGRDPDATTYAQLAATSPGLDQFSNELVAVENLIVAPATALQVANAVSGASSLPQVQTLFFCIPPNEKLLSYWSTVADRLYKIRHCLNLQGVAQPLPLYGAPINPLQLVGAASAGTNAITAATFTPVYRFSVYLERALELTNDVRAYGAQVLAALEKKDAEALAVLRAGQDLDIQTRMLDVKTLSVTEAQDQIVALQNQKAVVQIRRDYYANVAFLNSWELTALALQAKAKTLNGQAVTHDLHASKYHLLPSFTFGAEGFGGSPTTTMSMGGEQLAGMVSAWASAIRGDAAIDSESAGVAATLGGYQRRMDEWTLQANMAAAELVQMDSQIAAANDRLAMVTSERSLQQQQVANAQSVSDFLTSKYTNEELYDWMQTQLTAVHTQAYQLAFSLAQQAQAAYQYELGSPDSFIQFGYWDNQHKGLTAGESLLFDLRRMQAQYLAENTRELEVVKHVSLALTQPLALVQLLQTGKCNLNLDEALFDLDHPGQYFRRLRLVAVTVPCVTGPYTGVNATLTLVSAALRTKAPPAGYVPVSWPTPDPSQVSVTTPTVNCVVSTSHAQNDSGLFDVNPRDDRWLPFEGQGAVSTWTLELDPRDNAFELSTITDVVLHLRYTARYSNSGEVVRQSLKPKGARQIMLSVRSSFSDAYYAFFNPASTAAQQALVLSLAARVLPYSNLGSPTISDIVLYVVLKDAPTSMVSMPATFGPTSGTAGAISFAQISGTTNGGTPVASLVADAGFTGSTEPGSFTLTVQEASIPAALGASVNGHTRLDPAKIQDVVLLVNYSV